VSELEADGSEEKKSAGLTEDEMRSRVIALVFGGHEERYREFCEAVRGFVPAETAAVLRGSAVTGERWEDGAPFDADGPGTSDLDLTLVGTEILELYDAERGFYIPGVHTKPLSDAEPDVAPLLTPLRRRLMEMVGRPVNIQATRDFVLLLRERLMRQPYLTLVGSVEGASA
jgi:predicted nucleotidyltransferase